MMSISCSNHLKVAANSFKLLIFSSFTCQYSRPGLKTIITNFLYKFKILLFLLQILHYRKIFVHLILFMVNCALKVSTIH